MGKSYSWTEMRDQRMMLEEAWIVAGPEAEVEVTQALPGSVVVAREATVGDIVVQEYTPEVQQTIGELIKSFTQTMGRTAETYSQAIGQTAETGMKTTELLGEKLHETQVGTASILPGMAKYLLIAVVVIVVAGKVLKK